MAKLKFNLEDENEKLNLFLFEMDDLQEAFVEQAEAEGYTLDLSLDSLDELERYVIDTQVTFEDTSDAALAQRTNCWCYLGEVVRENCGGHWAFSANEENSVNWGMYVITGHSPVEGVEFEPLGTLKGFILHGTPGGLRAAVEADINPEEIDFSDIEEDK